MINPPNSKPNSGIDRKGKSNYRQTSMNKFRGYSEIGEYSVNTTEIEGESKFPAYCMLVKRDEFHFISYAYIYVPFYPRHHRTHRENASTARSILFATTLHFRKPIEGPLHLDEPGGYQEKRETSRTSSLSFICHLA